MKDDRKKIIALLCTMAIFAASIFVFPIPGFAGSALDEAKDELEEVTALQKEVKNKIKEGKLKINELSGKISSLEKQIYAAEGQINALQKEINTTKAQISSALAKLDSLQEDIDNQNEDLNARLRSMYKSGDIGMLAVLLGSNSMSEFMTNMDAIERIYNADLELLGIIQGKYDVMDAEKVELQALKDKLLAQQEEEKLRKASLETNMSTVSTLKSEVEKDNKALEAQEDQLEKDAQALTAKIILLQSSREYVGGKMCWPSPVSTRISSYYGMRIHPILKVKKFHGGIDIPASGGSDIIAANAGTVIASGWNASYGYMVMLDHGGGIVTLYAHARKLLVKKDDIVARGQTIALVGSTGVSTGNHIHFEVRENGKRVDPLGGYVSPDVRY